LAAAAAAVRTDAPNFLYGTAFEAARAKTLGECAVYAHPALTLVHLIACVPVACVLALLVVQVAKVGAAFADAAAPVDSAPTAKARDNGASSSASNRGTQLAHARGSLSDVAPFAPMSASAHRFLPMRSVSRCFLRFALRLALGPVGAALFLVRGKRGPAEVMWALYSERTPLP
jgi:hypothetical protein